MRLCKAVLAQVADHPLARPVVRGLIADADWSPVT
jgi:hypothetical protein